jgi:hypothetical protein
MKTCSLLLLRKKANNFAKKYNIAVLIPFIKVDNDI